MTDWTSIAAHVAAAAAHPFKPNAPSSVGGGCINSAYVLRDRDHCYFVKLNHGSLLPMFEAEAAGLAEMAATHTLRVPWPLCTGVAGGQAYIVMEQVPMGDRGGDGLVQAGRELAAMHRTTRSDFGWERDNTIGSTPQSNKLASDWVSFWRDRRLGFQLELAADNGFGGRLQDLGERLLAGLPALLDHDPRPSLLHGDLWGGNMGFDGDGNPVIFDPAVYYGDREADLAMTELFGGFGGNFYAAYEEAWSLDAGYRVRKNLYNLYHILNHLNLFGHSYLGQARGMMERLLAELG